MFNVTAINYLLSLSGANMTDYKILLIIKEKIVHKNIFWDLAHISVSYEQV
jgi:hypothetical protein